MWCVDEDGSRCVDEGNGFDLTDAERKAGKSAFDFDDEETQDLGSPTPPSAAADTMKIEDIVSDENNRAILRKLRGNDTEFTKLWLSIGDVWDVKRKENEYRPEGTAHDVGWLGYYIGKNACLNELHLSYLGNNANRDAFKSFCRGVNSNRSIQKIVFKDLDLSGGEIFRSLHPFFELNYHLSEIEVENCNFGSGSARWFASALKGCNRSLTSIKIARIGRRDEQFSGTIKALKRHPQLKELKLQAMSIRRNECIALANLISSTTTNLQVLNLYHNSITDEGVDALAGALTNVNLRKLVLTCNSTISTRGYQSLAELLEHPNSNLESLHLQSNGISDEGALLFANALATNRKLKTLDLYNNAVTAQGWSSFATILRGDNSSVNKTYLSNHSLADLGMLPTMLPLDLRSLLELNRSSNKQDVATRKILKHHQHFDMRPFFEWDLKLLSLAIEWFERACSIVKQINVVPIHSKGNHSNQAWRLARAQSLILMARLDKQKLNTIHQFIHVMPEVFEHAPVAG